MKRNKEQLARYLGDVRFAEKQVEKLKAKLPPMEARIKQALQGGNRDLAKQYALDYEQQKLEIKQGEQKVALAKKQFEIAKQQGRDVASAKNMGKIAKSMNALADSMNVLSRDDDMLRKIEEEVAYSEAKLDIAMESSGGMDLPAAPPSTSPEDILREFED